jgi:hypothetical protein
LVSSSFSALLRLFSVVVPMRRLLQVMEEAPGVVFVVIRDAMGWVILFFCVGVGVGVGVAFAWAFAFACHVHTQMGEVVKMA